MPFFGGTRHAEPEPVYEPEPVPETRKHGLFSRKEPEPVPVATHHEPAARKHGLFHRNASQSPPRTTRDSASSLSSRNSADHGRLSRSTGTGGSMLRKLGGRGDEVDPSIVAARERVMRAETAEMNADKALNVARREARDAKEQVRLLEEEAREDSRRAKIKEHQAREVSKRGQGLGREYFIYWHMSVWLTISL